MIDQKFTPRGPNSWLGVVNRRSLVLLLLAGVVLTSAVFGAVGLAAAGPVDQQASVEDGLYELFGSLWTADSGGDVSVTTDSTVNVSEQYPHSNSEPLPELRNATENPGVSKTSRNVSSLAIEAQIHQRVNEIRRDRNLSPIDFSRSLSTHARAHSEDMYDRDYFAHENPDNETAADRIPNAFRYCSMVGENLHYRTWSQANASTIANATVEGWMNSPGHRQNLLRENWTVQGLGVYIGTTDRRVIVYSTQKFCAAR